MFFQERERERESAFFLVEGVKIPLLLLLLLLQVRRHSFPSAGEDKKSARNTTANNNNNNNNNNDGSGVAFSRTTRRDESDFYVDPYVSRGKGSGRSLSPFSVF